MKKIKYAVFCFLLLFCYSVLVVMMYVPAQKFTGRVIEISPTSGHAKIITTGVYGQDTIVNVHHRQTEEFKLGQIITVWTNGRLYNGLTMTQEP